MNIHNTKKPRKTFKERKDKGDIGEHIVFSALINGIIPNSGSLRMFLVTKGDEDSIKYNLVNGDMGFLGLNRAECRVDVKCGDWVSERCLDNIDDGVYLFLNAYPNGNTTGLPFMFKLDFSVKKWIKENCEKDFDEEDGKIRFRILKHKLTEFIPAHYIYKFDEKLFCSHRTECLIKLGKLKP
jgi:hypothetical protein